MSNELTKSARRVFDILELFRERQCPLRLKDIVNSLGMQPQALLLLLKTMAQMNYLSFESTSRAYLPTLRLCTTRQLGNGGELQSGADAGSVPPDWPQGRRDDFAGHGLRTSMSRSLTSFALKQPLQYYTARRHQVLWCIPALAGVAE